jgi:hypothetical protein
MTSSGRNHWALRAAARGGGGVNGGSAVASGATAASSSARLTSVKPGADLAGVAQRTALLDADQQGSQVDRLARALHPAADDELLLGPDLDLQPAVGSHAGHIRRAAILGHGLTYSCFMARSLDTSADANQRQLAVFRSMTPNDRLQLADTMSTEVRVLAESGIRQRHPEYSAEECRVALTDILLGRELAAASRQPSRSPTVR